MFDWLSDTKIVSQSYLFVVKEIDWFYWLILYELIERTIALMKL